MSFFSPAFILSLTGSPKALLRPSARLLGTPALPPAPWFSCLKLSFAFRLSSRLCLSSRPVPPVCRTFFEACYLPIDWCGAGSQGAPDVAAAALASGGKCSTLIVGRTWKCPKTMGQREGKQPAVCGHPRAGAAEEGRAEAESGSWTPSDPT